ncbi:translation initiation factor eIF-2B subunit delta-like [Mizuhopecten yessoensis]|uniref:Translation initiation factor eIF2B subunit delta n=1 Tax=Mizuhopecten yessoensis TaxID=6573 RepID=A0A210QSI4_MIZYE|nr:translation initiation factor eIF-2B subunit delta-like [Mizuhopecten yessoensis]XP_021350852.1 translation initiation factor eIF-2B subunit delta-like [Mizuhopecten yessoensis]OWF51685.1 Translation initiation factor eIF-2B subunit delta [Mizuhopecten yessoensis]
MAEKDPVKVLKDEVPLSPKVKVHSTDKDQSQQQGSSKKKDKKKDKKPLSPRNGNKGQGQTDKGQGHPDKSQTQVPVDKGKDQSDKGQGQSEDGTPQKSKAELKAERRAIQEAQRAAKLAAKSASTGKDGGQAVSATPPPVTKKEPKRVPDHLKADDAEIQKKLAKKLEKQQIPQRTSTQRKVRLFNHLHQYERQSSLTNSLKFSTSSSIHPAIVKLGVQYAEGIITGSNARCLAMLAAFKQVVTDYVTPQQKELSRDLEARIKPYISFLNQCRLISVSMGNAIKYLKWNISHIPRDSSEIEAKKALTECIDRFVREKILLAGDGISKYVKDEKKIADGDVIVVFGSSSLVKKVLCDAHRRMIKFGVIVVDGQPRMEGREMLRKLVRCGIKCSYVLMNAASYVMQEATKVFLGAHALLANGCVMSRVGSSLIALIAKSYNIPVLVCCETYKFCERGQTDSFVFNELGDPEDLVSIGNKTQYLTQWRDHASLTLLNLVYDVMPQEFVSLVITELGLIPCTSVPVVLRMQQIETNET